MKEIRETMYSIHAGNDIRERLVRGYGVQKGLAIWHEVERQFREKLAEMPENLRKDQAVCDPLLLSLYEAVVPGHRKAGLW